jgi:hypothetical protein
MTSETTLEGMSGREASMLRRRMLSQGKTALPSASERVRSGFREATMSADVRAAAQQSVKLSSETVKTATPAPEATTAPPAAQTGRAASMARRQAMTKGKATLPSTGERTASSSDQGTSQPTPRPIAEVAMPEGGREASLARRKALSKGKSALPPVAERVRSGFREAELPQDVSRAASQQGNTASAPADESAPSTEGLSGREIAQQYRARRAQHGRGDMPASGATRAARQGTIAYPAKVPSITTAVSNATVTGLNYAAGRAMTGAEAGRDKPLTGTQYVAGSEGSYRASSGKVGHARTMGGQTVSGTMVRSGVRITGDENNADAKITGNADQRLADVDGAGDSIVQTGAQFVRQSQPHGASVFGANLGRSAGNVGSRSRDTKRAVEQTLLGHAVSGTAIGRSARVTGDEAGSNRSLTGSQYLASAADHATRGPEDERADPASGGKVSASETWGGQTITGPKMEHDARVTGSEHGSCHSMTGTPYYGATTAHEWCDPAQVEAEGAYRARRAPRAITGNVPLNDPAVSGTGRGADRDITGSRYFVGEERAPNPAGDPVTRSIASFSVMSPQRATHLESVANHSEEHRQLSITGTFARGDGKVTGNAEFRPPSRGEAAASRPARSKVSGEGSTGGTTITGSAWGENSKVTGTEGYISSGRNPTERAGSSHTFAGARKFKGKALNYDPVSPVTGATGGTPDSGATVTLSGGAAG